MTVRLYLLTRICHMSILQGALDDTAPPLFVVQGGRAVLSIERVSFADFLESLFKASFDVFGLYNETIATRYICL